MSNKKLPYTAPKLVIISPIRGTNAQIAPNNDGGFLSGS